jgi:hypothetical protein
LNPHLLKRDSLNIRWNIFEFFRYLQIKAITKINIYNIAQSERVSNVLALESLTHGQISVQAKEHGEEEFGDFTHVYDSFERINGSHIPLVISLETVKNSRYTRFDVKTVIKSTYLSLEVSSAYKDDSRAKRPTSVLTFRFEGFLEPIADQYKTQCRQVFQTYWPVLFHVAKNTAFRDLLFNIELNQGKAKHIDLAKGKVLYEICKDIGLAFNLNITTFYPFTTRSVKKLNLVYFRDHDLQAVQSMFKCLEVLLFCVRTCNRYFLLGE